MKRYQIVAIYILALSIAPTVSFFAYDYLVKGFERTPVTVNLNGDSTQERIELLEKGLETLKKQLDECRDVIEDNKSSFNSYVRQNEANTRRVNQWADVVEKQKGIIAQQREMIQNQQSQIINERKKILEYNNRVRALQQEKKLNEDN